MPKSKTIRDNKDPVEKREIFCLHYLKTFNASEAYRQVSDVNEKSLSQAASRYLNYPQTQERLKELASNLIQDIEQDIISLVNETKRIASFDPMSIMDIDDEGRPKLNLKKADADTRRMLNIEFSSTVDKDGCVHHLYKLRSLDKMDALEKLYKYYKLYNATGGEREPSKITVNVNLPIPAQQWDSNEPDPPDVVDIFEQWSGA